MAARFGFVQNKGTSIGWVSDDGAYACAAGTAGLNDV